MSSFVRPTKKPVDPAALERFAAGADDRRAAIGSGDPSPAQTRESTPAVESQPAAAPKPVARVQHGAPPDTIEKQSEQVLWRVSPSTLAAFNFVFENTNVKSKQKLLDLILLPELERRAEEIRKGR